MNLGNFPLLSFPFDIQPVIGRFPTCCRTSAELYSKYTYLNACSPCFIRSRSGVANSYTNNPAPRSGYRMLLGYPTITAIEWMSIFRCVCYIIPDFRCRASNEAPSRWALIIWRALDPREAASANAAHQTSRPQKTDLAIHSSDSARRSPAFSLTRLDRICALCLDIRDPPARRRRANGPGRFIAVRPRLGKARVVVGHKRREEGATLGGFGAREILGDLKAQPDCGRATEIACEEQRSFGHDRPLRTISLIREVRSRSASRRVDGGPASLARSSAPRRVRHGSGRRARFDVPGVSATRK